MEKQKLIALDLETTLVLPEAWELISEKTGIEALMRTTADEPDYNKLMDFRIEILKENNITIDMIRDVIDHIKPIDGAVEFLDELRVNFTTVIISDTFREFAQPIFEKMKHPLVFCHSLVVDDDGYVVGYKIRDNGTKPETVKALQSIGYHVTAIGDSLNDVGMLKAADRSMFLHAPERVSSEFKEFPVCNNYEEARKLIYDHE